MTDDGSVQLQALLDRMRAGDAAARRAFLERVCGRLRRLAAKIVQGSFPIVGNRHDVDSVVHETWLRLAQALDKTDPPSVADFFRLAAFKVRQVLLDMAERQRRQALREPQLAERTSHSPIEPADRTHDPAKLALWTEFHERVENLPDAERAVFEMHYYLDLPQAEIARLLDLHPRKVSYLWVSATETLGEGIGLAPA